MGEGSALRDDTAALRVELLGALVGMARAADPDDLPEEGVEAAVDGLTLGETADAAALRELIERAHAVKYALSPGCRDCQHPCGRTADFDPRELELMQDAEVRALRLTLLEKTRTLAGLVRQARALDRRDAGIEAFFCDGLMGFAHEFTAARLRPLLARADALAAQGRTLIESQISSKQ